MIYDEEVLLDKIRGFMSRKEVQYPGLGNQKTQTGMAEIIQKAHMPYTHYPHVSATAL